MTAVDTEYARAPLVISPRVAPLWHDGDMRARIASWLLDSFWSRVSPWTPPSITRADIRFAYAIAVAIDVAQMLLGPFGWEGFDEVLDAIAMVVISRLIGFHPLLLPTFVLEFIPAADMLPAWTACVALVVRARKRHGLVSDDAAPAIDIKVEKVE